MEALEEKKETPKEELDRRFFELLKHYNQLLTKVEMLIEEARKRQNK